MQRKKRTAKSTVSKSPVDSSADFEKLLRKAQDGERFTLRLYVTGNTVRSSQAISNIRSLCEEYLKDRYDLEVVDIYQQPSEAARDQVIAAPTLIKELPRPVQRLIGDLSNRDRILVGLNLVSANGSEKSKAKTHWVKL